MDAADLMFAGLAEQARLVAAGEVTSRELVDASLRRIDALDGRLNAFRIVLGDRARAEADAADAGRSGAPGADRPLHGVPVAIKDDADVAGEVTTNGTIAYGAPKDADSEVVRRLREAGAIVVGKTNVPEMTITLFTETLAFGATRNPWDLMRTPGGSSGGSGAAVASGMVGGALGSDGMGSIRIPAAFCGLFGLKPSRGRVSIAPSPSGWHGLSVFGPLVRRVADAAAFLDATADRRPPRPFADALDPSSRRPLRIALSYATAPGSQLVGRLDAQQRRGVEETAALLRSLGHEVVEHDPDFPAALFPGALACYLRGIHDEVGRMAHPERLERRTQGFARLGGLWPAGVVRRLQGRQEAIGAQVQASLAGFDVLLTPGPAAPAPEVGRWQGKGALATTNGMAPIAAYFGVFNFTGQPVAAIPTGMSAEGLPLGAQLVGRFDDEATLLTLAAQLEEARPWADRRPPIS